MFLEEQVTGIALSMIAVICVVLFITMSVKITLLVVLAVLLVDYYLVALLYFWDMTLNTYTGVNMVFALGMAVDYSIHIAHAFLLAEAPANCITS